MTLSKPEQVEEFKKIAEGYPLVCTLNTKNPECWKGHRSYLPAMTPRGNSLIKKWLLYRTECSRSRI